MTDPHPDAARNRQVVEEFRANHGNVRLQTVAGDVPAEALEGLPTPSILILRTTGARSGQPRENPLGYLPVGRDFAVFGSNGARATQPGWYWNVLAHPEAQIEVGADTVDVRARIAEGEERERIWSAQKAAQPGFAEYEVRVSRTIPVVILERR